LEAHRGLLGGAENGRGMGPDCRIERNETDGPDTIRLRWPEKEG
jgi:hypothetical protein